MKHRLIVFDVKLTLVCSPESSPEVRLRNTASISSITTTCKADRVTSPLQAANSASASENNPLTSFSEPLQTQKKRKNQYWCPFRLNSTIILLAGVACLVLSYPTHRSRSSGADTILGARARSAFAI